MNMGPHTSQYNSRMLQTHFLSQHQKLQASKLPQELGYTKVSFAAGYVQARPAILQASTTVTHPCRRRAHACPSFRCMHSTILNSEIHTIQTSRLSHACLTHASTTVHTHGNPCLHPQHTTEQHSNLTLSVSIRSCSPPTSHRSLATSTCPFSQATCRQDQPSCKQAQDCVTLPNTTAYQKSYV